jgi:GH25 family lysozyme M1 (1,4-beta-N-acetylmuramidase)
LGGDVSEFFDSSAWSCAVQGGWSFMIVRSYCSIGAPDPNALPTIQAAAAGGMKYRDVYHFPCPSIDAAQQVNDDVSAVGASNFNALWFDIETNQSPGCAWSGDTSSNCQFLQQMIAAGQSLGISMGVYASAYMWSSIMGDSCSVGADNGLPLWYAHYDGSRSFSDFSPFGGWSYPSVKQYSDSSEIGSNCGINADADYSGG